MATPSAENYREQRDRAVALAYNLAAWIDGQPSKMAAKQVDTLVSQFKEEQEDGGDSTEDVVADS
jgi:hypothetical protein